MEGDTCVTDVSVATFATRVRSLEPTVSIEEVFEYTLHNGRKGQQSKAKPSFTR